MTTDHVFHLVSICIELAVAAFVYGRLTERVKGHGIKLKELKQTDDDQWQKLNEHGRRLDSHGNRLTKLETLMPAEKGKH